MEQYKEEKKMIDINEVYSKNCVEIFKEIKILQKPITELRIHIAHEQIST